MKRSVLEIQADIDRLLVERNEAANRETKQSILDRVHKFAYELSTGASVFTSWHGPSFGAAMPKAFRADFACRSGGTVSITFVDR